jgi:hypothetical protein
MYLDRDILLGVFGYRGMHGGRFAAQAAVNAFAYGALAAPARDLCLNARLSEQRCLWIDEVVVEYAHPRCL